MESEHLSCLCGKIFAQTNALSNHKRKCQRSKTEITTLLSKAKVAWVQRRKEKEAEKRRKLDMGELEARAQDITPTQHGDIPAKTAEGSLHVHSQGKPNVSISDSAQSPTQTQVWADPTVAEGSSKDHPQMISANDVHSTDQSSAHLTSDLPLALRRSKRSTRQSSRLKDMIPCSAAILIVEAAFAQKEKDRMEAASEAQFEPESTSPTSSQEPDTLLRPTPKEDSRSEPCIQSVKNIFHMYRKYDGISFPSHDPEEELTLEDLSDIQCQEDISLSSPDSQADFGPYPNRSSFLVGEWYWNGQQKSKRDFRSLLDILTGSDFDVDDLRRTSWDTIDKHLGSSLGNNNATEEEWSQALKDAGWVSEEVVITVPFPSRANESKSKPYSVGHFYHRSIVSVLRERITSSESKHLHLVPHEVYWQPDDDPALRVYGELYNSPAFMDAHREIQKLPREAGCKLQRVVIALMFASDETHLTQFGETKLWPLYMFIGNDSKYRRVKPSHDLCNHLAYFIKLPDTFKKFVQTENGTRGPSSALLAHCLREVLHAQWAALLDKDFMDAYDRGIVEKCGFDGQMYRFYPRFFTYGADYKEKASLTSIRNSGNQPCPRCLVPKKEIHNLGLESDDEWRVQHQRVDNDSYRQKIADARTAIYEHNYVVDSKTAVDSLLKDESIVPVQTAFSAKLASHGFNFFEIFLVDLMHEIESGNWKSLFIHLLRILDSIGDRLIIELDSRYRQIPTFSEGIRKFRRNVSEMKNLAARDWEDMLQCAIPAFEGLLPEPHNSTLLDLLFCLARWHGFAKLRIHTDATLKLMDQITRSLGHCYRTFLSSTCASFSTRELAKEAAARARRYQAQSKSSASSPENDGALRPEPQVAGADVVCSGLQQNTAPDPSPTSSVSVASTGIPDVPTSPRCPGTARKVDDGVGARRPKTLNLNTYKFHSMGDYTAAIRRFGTTDSYSTERSELEHRTAKNRYSRTNKKDFIKQLVQIERRQAKIRTIRRQINDNILQAATSSQAETPLTPAERYRIGKSQNDSVFIPQFLQSNSNDPATKLFFNNLKAHLTSRIADHAQDFWPNGQGQQQQYPPTLFIQRDTMYRHKTVQLNYTTYDVRRSQDVINPGKPSHNIMMLSRSIVDEQTTQPIHPFIYGRVLGIFHVNVVSSWTYGGSKRMDFLWVRWYTHHPAASPLRPDKLSFPPLGGDDAFGFVDPKDVLRACHVIPCYAQGRRSPDRSNVSKLAQDGEDWKTYYVARFADRDLLMRYEWGMGIGHNYWFSSFSKEHRTVFQSSLAPSETLLGTAEDGNSICSNSFVTDDPNAMNQASDDEFDRDGELRDRENEELESDIESASENGDGSDDELY